MKTLSDYFPLPTGADQFPLEFIEAKGAIKIRETDRQITVGIVDVHDHVLTTELHFFLKKELEIVPIQNQDLAEYLSRQFSDVKGQDQSPDSERVLLDRLANDAPIVNLVNNILLEGIRKNCSDIHLESLAREVRVRYRIDGILHLGRSLTKDSFPGISSRIKVMANLNIIERRLPQDGRLSVSLGTQEVEFRVSIVPLAEGESIVLRLFQKTGKIASLDELGFSPTFLEPLRAVGKSPNGLILMTGPTGSGKTTSLNALINELSNDENKIITIEDPVENVLDGVNQIQTNEPIGLTFDSILRRLLRQDPDILMVGEIRDKKTAELSMRSSLTGHLVLSTLHTNDALSAIPRLYNMGIEPFLLAAVLRAVAAQRLVRVLCPTCKEKISLKASSSQLYKKWGFEADFAWVKKGCPECGQTGYKGRTVIGEIFVMDELTEEMIVNEKKRRDFVAYYQKLGNQFLLDDGFDRVRKGQTTLEELERAVLQK